MTDGRTADVVTIQISIEPRWTHDHHEGEIEISEQELEIAEKRGTGREAYIQKCVEDYVNEECPYGWSEAES